MGLRLGCCRWSFSRWWFWCCCSFCVGINDTKADIQKVESTVQEAKAGIYKDISDAARGVKSLVRESENRLALQAERNHCEVMKGQQEIKCLIENTAKDQEIARLNRVVDAQRDQNIINSVVQALGNKTA